MKCFPVLLKVTCWRFPEKPAVLPGYWIGKQPSQETLPATRFRSYADATLALADVSRGSVFPSGSSMHIAYSRGFILVGWPGSFRTLVDPVLHDVPGTEDVVSHHEMVGHLPATTEWSW